MLQAIEAGGTIYVCPGNGYGDDIPIISNATIIGAGEGNDPSVDTIFGGPVRIQSPVTASLRQVHITGGASSNGGGVFNEGNLTLTDCTIAGNEVSGFGGGITSTNSSTLTMIRCTVRNNVAVGASSPNGGGGGLAIFNDATLTNCMIGPNNDAGLDGGGIIALPNANGTNVVTLTNCTVSGNSAQNGGGIRNRGATIVVNGGSITENSADNDGDDIANEGNLTDNQAAIGECLDIERGCGCPGGSVCP